MNAWNPMKVDIIIAVDKNLVDNSSRLKAAGPQAKKGPRKFEIDWKFGPRKFEMEWKLEIKFEI